MRKMSASPLGSGNSRVEEAVGSLGLKDPSELECLRLD